MEFAGQQALVVGGTSGVGFAAAELLQRLGADVTIAGRTEETAAAAVARLGAPARALAIDITAAGGIDAAASTVEALDILVVTAGVTHFAPTDYETVDSVSRTVETNLSGTYRLLQVLAPKLRDGARLVLTTTVLARRYFFGATALSASRAGLGVVLRTFANELAPRGIRVNAVALGPIETEAWDKAGASADDRLDVAQTVLLGRLGRPAEVAEAIAFLASSRSSFVHGHELAVDGGWSVR